MRNACTGKPGAIRIHFPAIATFDYHTKVYWSMRIRLCGYVPIAVSIFRRGVMHSDCAWVRRWSERRAWIREESEARDHDNDRIGPDVPMHPGTTRRGKLHTHLRSSGGRLDTGREREAAKLRDESGAQPPVRARSIPGSSPARSRGSPRDRLYASTSKYPYTRPCFLDPYFKCPIKSLRLWNCKAKISGISLFFIL